MKLAFKILAIIIILYIAFCIGRLYENIQDNGVSMQIDMTKQFTIDYKVNCLKENCEVIDTKIKQ